MTEILVLVLRPLKLLSGWIKGCSCHEDDLKAGKAIQCPWKGCRGPMLAGEIQRTLHTMDLVRSSLIDYGAVPRCDIARAIGMAMADLATKLHWVTEPPYLIWQEPASDDSLRSGPAVLTQC